jgi:hypothetical protein
MMALRDERDGLFRGMERARGILRWEAVADRFYQALSGCRSVTFMTTKNPVRNRRLRLQAETLRARGIEVLGVGNFNPSELNPELGTWFNMRSIAPRR